MYHLVMGRFRADGPAHHPLGAGSIQVGRLEDARVARRAENLIGTRVRAARERLGWNRETLAFHSGISWSAIAQVESGRRTHVRPRTLHALARALGVTIDYLVAGGGAAHPMLTHRALLYGSELEFLDAAVPFLTEGIERGEAVIAVVSPPNTELLRERLGDVDGKLAFAERSSWYRTPASALDGYKTFLDERAAAGAPWVRILGEPPWEPRSGSELGAWVRYEAMLNLAFAAEPVTVLCAYDTRIGGDELCRQARATHPETVECGTVSPSADYADPLGFVLGP
jgi:transcriptional regulator with XRE-family HTH domain